MIVNICMIIIAVCEVIRMVQNAYQLNIMRCSESERKNLNNQFIDSLKKDNQQWAKDLLEDFVNRDVD